LPALSAFAVPAFGFTVSDVWDVFAAGSATFDFGLDLPAATFGLAFDVDFAEALISSAAGTTRFTGATTGSICAARGAASTTPWTAGFAGFDLGKADFAVVVFAVLDFAGAVFAGVGLAALDLALCAAGASAAEPAIAAPASITIATKTECMSRNRMIKILTPTKWCWRTISWAKGLATG
jgi:hypothetical protein